MKRVFLIVLDSLGIGEMPDAAFFGDEGSNTLKSISESRNFNTPNLLSLGLGLTDGVDYLEKKKPLGAYGRLKEASNGKDTTVGHWEIAGLISDEPLPTYPEGFPKEIINEFEKQTGRKVLCNKPYSGTKVIEDYGKEHIETGALIVYTSADSVFQIAAHEDCVPVEKLYEYCKIARNILRGKHGVGRVIARPFTGEHPYTRTSNRHDFSIEPHSQTLLDALYNVGKQVISVGKIADIFANRGITESNPTKDNADGMAKTTALLNKDFEGLAFINLVDFDSKYGHRNDTDGYALALSEFDKWLPSFISMLKEDDCLFITADHGCDPKTLSTDHSREYIPLLIYGKNIQNVNLGTLSTFADIGKTVADLMDVPFEGAGESFKEKILK